MYIRSDIIQFMKTIPNSGYDMLKVEFVYNSNKIEGSKFTEKKLYRYLDERIIDGSYYISDIYETVNSLELFDYIIDTLNQPIDKIYLLRCHKLLKKNTFHESMGLSGCYKKIPNRLLGVDIELAKPEDVEELMEALFNQWNQSNKTLEDVIEFHVQFETIHPFQDGNGRIGRMMMLKQCIENNLDIFIIYDEYSSDYKKGLTLSQKDHDYSLLNETIIKCRELTDKKLSFLIKAMAYIENENLL